MLSKKESLLGFIGAVVRGFNIGQMNHTPFGINHKKKYLKKYNLNPTLAERP